MADKKFLSPEHGSSHTPESQRETGGEQVDAQTSESLTENLAEVAEIMGEIPAENQSENKGKVSGGTLPVRQQTQTTATQVKPLKIPSLEIMRIQVSTKINKEIKTLEKEASRMMLNPTSFDPFKLNGIVAKIRELKDILSNLAFVTVETMKGWWMKFVKNNNA